jgi:lipopolysaccharide export system permease protein
MRLLDRYLLRELLMPFSLCLSGFIILYTMVDWAFNRDDFQEHALRAGDIFEYYAVKMPGFLVLLLPIALLLALLYTLSHHARYNEITAIRAAGVSIWRLALPYMIVGLTATASIFAMNEFLVSKSEERADRIMSRYQTQKNVPDRTLIQNFGFTNARDNRKWRAGTYNLNTSEMTDITIIWTAKDKSERWLYAERGRPVEPGWVFSNVREYYKSPATNSQLVPTILTNTLAMPEFSETRESLQSEVKISERLRKLQKGKISRGEIPIREILEYLRFHPNMVPGDRSWLHTVLHGRLASPWKCIVVVLIALPFGAASGRRNVFVGVASSIFICLAFHFTSEFSLALGSGGYIEPWIGGWLPNIAFGIAGLWMTARVR